MNLNELIELCGQKSGFNDSAYRPRWVNFINEAIREFARRQPWPGLEDLTTIKADGTRYLICPPYVDTVVSILNLTDRNPVDRSGDFDRNATSVWAAGTAGRACMYDRVGDVAVLKEPSGYIWFQSSHASDLQTLNVTGIVANSGASGALESTVRSLAVAAAGTSPVTLSVLFTKVFSVSKATDSNGNFFFYDAGATNAHISYLGATESEAAFQRLALLYKPAAGTEFELRFRYRIPKLTLDSQSPHPSVKPDFIVSHALGLHWGEQEQLQKEALSYQKATQVLQAEAHKDRNFNEPDNRIAPYIPADYDPAGDYFNRYYE
jgi:hypothetical protein